MGLQLKSLRFALGGDTGHPGRVLLGRGYLAKLYTGKQIIQDN